MDNGWQEVSSGAEIVELLDLGAIGAPLLERLLLAPESGAYLRVEIDERFSSSGTFDIRVPGTRFYFNVTACKSFKGDIAVALTAYFVTHSVPVAAIAAGLRKLNDNLEHLTDDEVSLVQTIIRASPGNAYEDPVAEEDVRERFRGDPDTVDDLLDSLQARGVVEGRRRNRIKLVY